MMMEGVKSPLQFISLQDTGKLGDPRGVLDRDPGKRFYVYCKVCFHAIVSASPCFCDISVCFRVEHAFVYFCIMYVLMLYIPMYQSMSLHVDTCYWLYDDRCWAA